MEYGQGQMEKLVMEQLFKGVYNGRKVLVTGHTGFKGSWLLLWLKQLGANVRGYALAPNTSPSHIELLGLLEENSTGDITNIPQLQEVFNLFKPEIVFHLAAQPLVKFSYRYPQETFLTNVIGTANVLDAARNTDSVKSIINITTDKVYKNFEWVWPYKETDRLGGYDPYSASKACSELVHDSYRQSFFKPLGINSATVRAGNVIGGGDWAADRLIPDLMRAIFQQRKPDIRNPGSVRPWQHVFDDSWNFGPDPKDCISVRQVLNKMNNNWGEIIWNDVSTDVKVHEANLLRLDCSKAQLTLGWQPVWNVDKALEHTASWYKAYYKDKQLISLKQLECFVEDAKRKSIAWTR